MDPADVDISNGKDSGTEADHCEQNNHNSDTEDELEDDADQIRELDIKEKLSVNIVTNTHLFYEAKTDFYGKNIHLS